MRHVPLAQAEMRRGKAQLRHNSPAQHVTTLWYRAGKRWAIGTVVCGPLNASNMCLDNCIVRPSPTYSCDAMGCKFLREGPSDRLVNCLCSVLARETMRTMAMGHARTVCPPRRPAQGEAKSHVAKSESTAVIRHPALKELPLKSRSWRSVKLRNTTRDSNHKPWILSASSPSKRRS